MPKGRKINTYMPHTSKLDRESCELVKCRTIKPDTIDPKSESNEVTYLIRNDDGRPSVTAPLLNGNDRVSMLSEFAT